MEAPKANIEFLQQLKSVDDFIFERSSEISKIIIDHERIFKLDFKKLSEIEIEAIAQAHARMIYLFMQLKPAINLFINNYDGMKEINHGMQRTMQHYKLFPLTLSPNDAKHHFPKWEAEEEILSKIKKAVGL